MVYQAYITLSVLRNKQPQIQWYRTVSISYHTHANRSAGWRSSSAHVFVTLLEAGHFFPPLHHGNGSNTAKWLETCNASEVLNSFWHTVTSSPTPLTKASHTANPIPVEWGIIFHLYGKNYKATSPRAWIQGRVKNWEQKRNLLYVVCSSTVGHEEVYI